MVTRGRNQAPVRSPRNNGHAMTPNPENHMSERSSRDLSQVQMSLHKGGGKSVSSDSPSDSPRRKVHPHANGSMHPTEQVVEFGSTGHAPSEAPGSGRHTNAGSSVGQNSSGSQGSPGMQWTKAELGPDENRYGFHCGFYESLSTTSEHGRTLFKRFLFGHVGLLHNHTV